MREIKGTHHYPVDVDEVFAFFTEDDLIQQKYQAIGARNVKIVEIEEKDGALVCCTSREVPSDVPSVLKAFLGAYNTVLQTERWNEDSDGALVCTFDVAIEGVPVKVQGRMHLSATDEGCVNRVEIKVNSDVLLVGNTLAEFVASDSEKAMEAEYAYIKKHCVD